MKKITGILLLAFAIPTMSLACDICGCGVGSNYIGILPEFSKKIVGLRYRYSSLRTHIGAGGTISYLTTDERYSIAEAWAGYNISKKFRLMATIPMNFNERSNQGITNSKNGLGDISLNAFYQLINSKKSINENKLLIQSLWLGGGVKLPTGKYNPADKSTTTESTNLFQLGTGSVDFTLNAIYDIRLQDMGLNVSATYKMNTANKYDYNYGNKLSTTVQLYHKWRIQNKVTLAPNIGLLYEQADKDIDGKYTVDISGGNTFAGSIGLETVFKKIAIGGNWQTPFSQNLANGSVKANNRAMVHISFLL